MDALLRVGERLIVISSLQLIEMILHIFTVGGVNNKGCSFL